MTTLGWVLLGAGALALATGAALPGWDTESQPKRAVKRRIFWGGTAVGVVLLFLAGLPDIQSCIGFAAAAVVLMTGLAYFRTPHIKIGNTIYAAYEPHRQPDPPPGITP